MTDQERILATLRGEATDRLPWAPRLDLWFKARQRAGALPRRYRHATLRDLVDDLGWGLHAVVPDFRDVAHPDDHLDRGLGLFNLRTMPYRTVLENVERAARVGGARTLVEYRTPFGTVATVVRYDAAMEDAGITLSHVERPPFQGERDYAALGCLFENARVEPRSEGFEAFADYVGDRGLPVAWVSAAASPMHFIQRELMPFDVFFYEAVDHPEALARLAEQVEGYWQRVLEAAFRCPARVFLVGANYDATVTHPRFFRDQILPWLRRAARDLHARGRYLLTHADGENTGLLQHYLDAEVDIADSVCPAPMTKLTLRQVREAFGGRITILGGIPSVALLREAMSDRDFGRFLDRFFADLGRGDHLVLGVSDTTPPGAEFERLVEIGRRAAAFGPIRPRQACRPGSS